MRKCKKTADYKNTDWQWKYKVNIYIIGGKLKMTLISSQSPDNPMFVNASGLADRVYPGYDYPALEQSDMIQVYVSLDISAQLIIFRLCEIYDRLGYPTENNEFDYMYEIDRLIMQLEIYDKVMIKRGESLDPATHHSSAVTKIAVKMIEKLLKNDGTAETFPYNSIEDIKEKFGIDYSYEI